MKTRHSESQFDILIGIGLILLLIVAIVIGVLIVASPAHAAPVQAQKHQVIAGLSLRQDTGEAEIGFSTVDAGPLPKRLAAKDFKHGVMILDDAGRAAFIRGSATLTWGDRAHQEFKLTGGSYRPIDDKPVKVIRVTHTSVIVFTGNDWAHPWDSGQVCNGQIGLERCVGMWFTVLP